MVGTVCPSTSFPEDPHADYRLLGDLSWGGSRIIRYTRDGEMDLEVFFPTALNITACTFGGKRDQLLYCR